MYCPNCGADNQTADSYCKRCGEWLTDFKKGSLASFGGQTPQQYIFTGLFMTALSAVGALLSAIALYATYLGTDEAKWSVYLAGGFCVCIAAWQLSSFIVGLKLRRRLNHAHTRGEDKAQLKPTSSPALPAADTSNFIPVSVTEHTTELLQPLGEQRSKPSIKHSDP